MASQAALYFLALDDPQGNIISCFATKADQARIVLDSSRAMAKKAKSFLQKTGVEVLAHKVVHEDSNSQIRAMSSDDKSQDGLNDILAIMDELHAQDQALFDVVYSGLSKRKDSLMLCITTAGFSTDSVGYFQSVYAKKVAMGEMDDDLFFSLVYTIDEGDDIFEETTWKKANPNYGISVDPETFEAKAKKAMVMPNDLPNFKVKHLNTWISESKAFFDTAKWDLCYEPGLTMDRFLGKKCVMSLDLASKVDLVSRGFVFEENGLFYVFDKSYIPEDTVRQVKNSLYETAIAEGHLIMTPGEAIHYPNITRDIIADSKKFKITEVPYDPWNATHIAQDLTKEKLNMLEFRFNTGNLSEPTKNFDALIRQGKVRHNGSPILKWSLGNVVCKEDAAGNVFPRKTHDKLKIDPIIALIMSFAVVLQKDKKESVYESRGLRSV